MTSASGEAIMFSTMGTDEMNPYRLIPSVEDTLGDLERREEAGAVSRALLISFLQDVLDGWRAAIKAGELDAAELERRLAHGEPVATVLRRIEREQKSGLVRVINAAGVVLHTGLGRAPIHPEAAAAMASAAQGYCVLEVTDSAASATSATVDSRACWCA